MYYNDHLLVDYEHPLQMILVSYLNRTKADDALDALYADILPLEPMTRTVDTVRVGYHGDRYPQHPHVTH